MGLAGPARKGFGCITKRRIAGKSMAGGNLPACLQIVLSPVSAPFFQHAAEIRGQLAFEQHRLAGARMDEAQRFRVEGLAGNDLKTIFNKLFVFAEDGPFQHLVSAICCIVEQRMAYMFHVRPYLVGPARSETAFYDRDVAEILH